MSFRDDGDALRNRVESLEDELARTKEEAERLRAERDRVLSAPRVAEIDVRSGAKLWVEWRGTWWPATVLHEVGNGLVRIHYDGWASRWDENVGASRMAPRDRPPPGPRAGVAKSSLVMLVLGVIVMGAIAMVVALGPRHTTSSPGVSVLSTRTLSAGQSVWVAWGGTWYDATIVSIVDETSARVHYTGWGTETDETVTLDRIHTR